MDQKIVNKVIGWAKRKKGFKILLDYNGTDIFKIKESQQILSSW